MDEEPLPQERAPKGQPGEAPREVDAPPQPPQPPVAAPKPAPRTSKARRTQLAQQERARALEQRMWQVPTAPAAAAAPAEAGGARTGGEGGRKRVRPDGDAGEESDGGCAAEPQAKAAAEEEEGEVAAAGMAPTAAPAVPAVVRALEARLATTVRQATVSLLDLQPDARTLDTISAGSRRKFGHPLDRWPHEVELWIEDEAAGSLSQLARLNLGLPHDTWERAAWRASMATEHAVLSMPIRHRRRLYTLMRHITEPTGRSGLRADGGVASEPKESEAGSSSISGGESFVALAAATADHLVPELGITLGQLSVFHILHARTQYVRKMDLDAHLAATGLMGPHARAGPIATDVLEAGGGGTNRP